MTMARSVAGRYRLETELGAGPYCRVYRAVDETLQRQVCLRFFDVPHDRRTLAERAAVAATLTHPRVVRIFDTGFDGGRFFTVSELLPGSLAWAKLPLPHNDVVQLAVHVAEALSYAHQRGVTHGSLHPGNVLLGEQGAKVADFALSSRMLEGHDSDARQDLAQLGSLLEAVAQHDESVPGERARPRRLRAVIRRLRSGGYADAQQALADLHDLADRPARTPGRRTGRVSLGLGLAGAALTAAAFGLVDWTADEPAESRPAVSGSPLPIATVADFDPQGDGKENRGTVVRVTDGDPASVWFTERYRSGPHFGPHKSGVGVILDLGEATSVGAAQIQFASAGCSYQLRYSTVRSWNVDHWEVVASAEHAQQTSEVVFPATRSRWWLVWITGLTRHAGSPQGYGCGIGGVALFRP